LDRSSFTFRHPVNKLGAPLLPAPRKLDIEHFQSVMDQLEFILSGTAACLDSSSTSNAKRPNGLSHRAS
jgi:hypothetical protein